MREHFDIAGYCRISVDEEAGRDNVSIENQKAIIQDYVRRTFPDSTLTFYEDRDASRAATAAVLWSWKTCVTRGFASSPSATA